MRWYETAFGKQGLFSVFAIHKNFFINYMDTL